MLANYLRTAFRALARHRAYAAVNVFGLAFGLACCLLIGLFVLEEFSYDRFHHRADDTYAVAATMKFADQEFTSTSTPAPLAPAISASSAIIEDAIRTTHGSKALLENPNTKQRAEVPVLYADSQFFGFFPAFELLRGDPATALSAPNTIVLTPETARLLFGDADPLGQTVETDRYVNRGASPSYTVTGIVAEAPDVSSIKFGAVASYATVLGWETGSARWGMSSYLTYLRAAAGADVAEVDTALMQAYRANAPDANDSRKFFATPLTDLYLSDLSRNSGFSGSSEYVRLFSFIALVVLFVALINYMNLATARASLRAKEVGVRKSLGASRGQLAAQFLTEALVLTGLAFALSLVLTELALPIFNAVFEKDLSLAALLDLRVVVAIVVLLLVVGVIAGSYPALYLSRFRPVEILRGQSRSGTGGAAWLRRGLVVVQFAATMALLVACFVVVDQLRFAQQRDLGFQPAQVLSVKYQTTPMGKQEAAIKAEALKHPGVLSASSATDVPSMFTMQNSFAPDPDDEDASISTYALRADADYAETVGLKVVAGRDFDASRPSDATDGLLVNQAFVERVGWDDPVGRAINFNGSDAHIIGVLEDFHFGSLRNEIAPVLIEAGSTDMPFARYNRLVVRFDPAQTAEVTAHLTGLWEQFGAKKPADIRFLDEAFASLYETDRKLAQVFGFFAVVAIIIAALGLFGLAAFAAERRTKEIGIRKVLGASTGDVVGLLSKEFAVLLGVAFALAAPVAYLVMRRWLDGFAYGVDLSPLIFAGAGAAAAVVALAVVSTQAVRAARRDPVLSLRAE